MRNIAKKLTPAQVRTLARLGENIATAIIRRRLTRSDVADRAGVSVPTLRAITRGDPGVSIGAYLLVLGILGLDESLGEVADPRSDEVGLAMEMRSQPKRIRAKGSQYDF